MLYDALLYQHIVEQKFIAMKNTFKTIQKAQGQKSLTRIFVFTVLILLAKVHAQDNIDEPILNTPYVSITNTEQMIWFTNAQHLVNKWNNIIIHAKTGAEQLETMNNSGIFAKDVKLTFDFGNGQTVKTTGLTDEPLPFYSQFVDPLKKERFNIAANVDVVEFGEDHMRFNFKHSIFMGGILSLVGENQVIMRRKDDRFFITAAYIKVILNNTEHGY